MRAALSAYFEGAIWFWIAAGVFWWHMGASTLGVPNALILDAARSERDAALFEGLARRNVARAAEAWRRWGPLLVGLSAFAVAFGAVLTVTRRDGFSAAAICLIGPAAAYAVWSRRVATRLAETQPDMANLRRGFLALRAGVFAAAIVSILAVGAIRYGARYGLWP